MDACCTRPRGVVMLHGSRLVPSPPPGAAPMLRPAVPCRDKPGPTFLPVNYASPVLHHVLVEGGCRVCAAHAARTVHARRRVAPAGAWAGRRPCCAHCACCCTSLLHPCALPVVERSPPDAGPRSRPPPSLPPRAAGLAPGTKYYYRVGDPRFYWGLSDVRTFTTYGPTKDATTYPFK